MSIYDKDLFGVSKHDQSIKWIQSYTQGMENVICAFSGGKDSQCCYHLMKEAQINFRAVYTITRFEPPELLRFIRQNYPDVEIIRNFKRSLTDDIAFFGLPNRWYRWCCGVKHDHYPIPFDLKVIGVRWEESPRRKETWRVFGFDKSKKAYLCPIATWTTVDVWEYLNTNHIPHCELYDQGYTRIGCVMCPLASPKNRQLDMARYPKHCAMLRKAGDKFVALHSDQPTRYADNWRAADNPAEEYWQRWVATGQTEKPKEYFEKQGKPTAEDDFCLFASTGLAADEGETATNTTKE